MGDEVFVLTNWLYGTFKVLDVSFAALYCHEAMPQFLQSKMSHGN